jgi:hypothetical protein
MLLLLLLLFPLSAKVGTKNFADKQQSLRWYSLFMDLGHGVKIIIVIIVIIIIIINLRIFSSVQYCLIEMNGGVRTFRVPALEDVLKHRVIVVTLSISMYLSTLGLHKGMYNAL